MACPACARGRARRRRLPSAVMDNPVPPRPPEPRPRRRDRHGRGMRGPIAPPQVPLAVSRAEAFVDLVQDSVERLERRWPQLADVDFMVLEVPAPSGADAGRQAWDAGAVPLGADWSARAKGGRDARDRDLPAPGGDPHQEPGRAGRCWCTRSWWSRWRSCWGWHRSRWIRGTARSDRARPGRGMRIARRRAPRSALVPRHPAAPPPDGPTAQWPGGSRTQGLCSIVQDRQVLRRVRDRHRPPVVRQGLDREAPGRRPSGAPACGRRGPGRPRARSTVTA